MIYKNKQLFKIICLLLFNLFLFLAQTNDILFSIPISIDGTPKTLSLLRGQSIEKAAFDFANENKLFQSNEKNHIKDIITKVSTVLNNKINEIKQLNINKETKVDNTLNNIILSIPLTLDGIETELKLLKNQGIEDAILNYYEEYGIPNILRSTIAPQLIELLRNKLKLIKEKKDKQYLINDKKIGELLFKMQLTIENQQFVINHYNGNDLEMEAKEFCTSIGVTSPELLNHVIPQVTNRLKSKLNEYIEEKRQEKIKSESFMSNKLDDKLPNPIHFTIPLTINEKNVDLIHYKNQTPKESVDQFLQLNKLMDPSIYNTYAPQLLDLIMTRLDQMNQKNLNQNKGQEQEQIQNQDKILFTIPLVVRNKNTEIKYYEGENPELTAIEFLKSQSIFENDPLFDKNVQNLSKLIRDKLENIENEKKTEIRNDMEKRINNNEPIFSLPVTISNKKFDIPYYISETPNFTAKKFCNENHLLILGTDSIPNEKIKKIDDCIELLEKTISSTKQNIEKKMDATFPSSNQNIVSNISTKSTENMTETSNPDMSLDATDPLNENNIRDNIDETEKIVNKKSASISTPSDSISDLNIENSKEDKIVEETTLVASNNEQTVEMKDEINESLIEDSMEDSYNETIDNDTDSSIIDEIDGKKRIIMFTLDIDIGDNRIAELSFYNGDNPETVAKEFCKEHNLDLQNVPSLVETINLQLDDF